MRTNYSLCLLPVAGLVAGCASNPESTSYAEWQQEQKARWEAKHAGIEYKTKEQLRMETAELQAIAAEVMNANVRKPHPALCRRNPPQTDSTHRGRKLRLSPVCVS